MWQSYSILFPQETIWTQNLQKRHFSNSDTCRIVRGKNMKCLTIWQVNTNWEWSFKKAWSEDEMFAWTAGKVPDRYVMVFWHDITNPERKDNVHIGKNEGKKCYMQRVYLLLTLTQRIQTSLRCLQDVLKRSRRPATKPDVIKTSCRRRLI